jgi:hypothetical protein
MKAFTPDRYTGRAGVSLALDLLIDSDQSQRYGMGYIFLIAAL